MDSNFEIGADYEAFIADAVKTGRYDSPGDVVRESLRLLQEREEERTELELSIARSVADADAGRVHDAEEVFDRLEAKYRAMAEAKRA